MATGACGIHCDVCRLNVRGTCSTCGAGTSQEAARKLAAQERLLGAPCPILACARLNHIDYCLRDCSAFPCDNFAGGPYPFSDAYLHMHRRRRAEKLPPRAPSGAGVTVPDSFWKDVQMKPMAMLASTAGAAVDADGGLVLTFLQEKIRVDVAARSLQRHVDGRWETSHDPMTTLVVLNYLLTVQPEGLAGNLVGVNDLKSAHFFQGPHALRIDHLVTRFGNDGDAFVAVGRVLGGAAVDHGADAAIRLWPLPKVPLYYLLWTGDDEFPAALSVLFDESIEAHLKADAIWGLVTLVSDALFNAP